MTRVPNPTHGSGWIVQVQPTRESCPTSLSRIPPTGVGGSFRSSLHVVPLARHYCLLFLLPRAGEKREKNNTRIRCAPS